MATKKPASDKGVQPRVDELNRTSWDRAQSDPREALAEAEEAERLAVDGGYLSGRATALLNAGWALIYTADYDGALKRLHEALDITHSLEDTEGRLKVLNALGVIAHRVGDSERALERYRETLNIARATGSQERLLAALNNLGELSASLNQLDDARSYYQEAHEFAKDSGGADVMAIIKINLAAVFHTQGDLDTARPFVEDGIRLAEESEDRIAQAEGLCIRGAIHADNGDLEEAEACHRAALALSEETGHPRGIVNVLNGLGAVLLRGGRLDEARDSLRRASEISERIGIPISSLTSYERLAGLYEEEGSLEEALSLRKRLSGLQQRVFNERTLRRLTTMRTEHELEQSRAEAEIFRLRNVELREKTEQLEASKSRMELIAELAREITASLDLDEVTNLLYTRINSLMEAAVFGIALYDETKRVLDYALFIEEGQRITPFTRSVDDETSFAAWAVRNAQEIVIQDAMKEYRQFVTKRTPLTGKLAKSIVYLPLKIEERIVGVVTVQSHRKHGYDDSQLDLLRTLAAYIAIALDNSRKHSTIQELNKAVLREKSQLEQAYERIAHMANHDNLTELPNRRLLKELLSEHIPLARRQRRKFGVVYLDLDDFKPVNDTFGHAAGDSVLVKVADRLRSTVRASDTVARIGGDEFILVLRDIEGREGLERIAEKVLDTIRMPVKVGDQMCTLGASVGVSVFPRDGETADALIAAADRAMYQVKSDGKLGVRFAEGRHPAPRTEISDSSISSSSNTN